MHLEVKIEGLEKFKALVDTKVWYKAQKRTMTEMGRKFRTRVVKDVRKVYNVKAKTLKKHIKEHISKASSSSIEWRFSITGRPVNLIHFGARQTSKGVSVKVKKGSGRRVIKSAFIAHDNGSHKRVFMRKGKERMPIEAKSTLSYPQMFNKEIIDKAMKEVEENYDKEFKHNLDYYLGRLK